jgi:hypothetical protein
VAQPRWPPSDVRHSMATSDLHSRVFMGMLISRPEWRVTHTASAVCPCPPAACVCLPLLLAFLFTLILALPTALVPIITLASFTVMLEGLEHCSQPGACQVGGG